MNEWQEGTKVEKNQFEESVKQHQEGIRVLLEEQDLVKKNTDFLNEDLIQIKSKTIEENNVLNQVTEQKKLVVNETKELEKEVVNLKGQVNSLKDDTRVLNLTKLSIESDNKKLIEDGLLKFKELEVQSQKELKNIEEEKNSKKVQLKKTEDALVEVTSKLEAIKGEYDKITGMIAGFIGKKNEVERKEIIIKKKYEEAGFSW